MGLEKGEQMGQKGIGRGGERKRKEPLKK